MNRSFTALARLVRRTPLLMILLAPASLASDSQWWIADSPDDYAKADARGVVVGADGTLELGPATTRVAAEGLGVIWALASLPEGRIALAGDNGQISRWSAREGVRPWIKLPVGQVLSLLASRGSLYAGTGPEGLVYRIGSNGDTALVARTGERYVWGLAEASGGAIWAATGTRGRLLKIEGGSVRTLLDTDESNLVCALSDGRGGVFAGGDSKGRVFRVTSAGTPGTVFDATEDEIRALVIGPDGALYAAGLSASAVGNDEDDEPAARPAPVTSAVSGGRATIYRIVPDSLVQSWWTSAEPFVFALASTPGGVVAATGNRAGLYRIERLQGASRWLSSSEGQVTALAADRDGVLYAATSNPGALWIVGRERGAKGDIRSPALDARRIASFGRLVWRGEARGSRVRLSARSGNSDPPDTTWSEWQGGETGPEGRALSVPPARYFQWKVELEGGDGRLDAIMASWRERNLPPRLTDFVVAPQGTSFREGEITPRTENVTQTLPGGQKVEFSLPSSPTPRALRALPMWTRGLRTLQWKGSDPNGDELTYRVDVRREPAGAWISVGKELDATSFTWDTNALPDGRYRLRVMVSDAKSNAVGEDAADSTFSEPFIVDNTAPEIGAFTAGGEAGGIAIEGRASDATSPLSRLEIAVDDEDWIPLSPSDGLADGLEESFRARVPAPAGERTIGLRVVDLAGNSTVRSLPVSVPRAR